MNAFDDYHTSRGNLNLNGRLESMIKSKGAGTIGIKVVPVESDFTVSAVYERFPVDGCEKKPRGTLSTRAAASVSCH